jgi:hypothetical protein
LKTMLKRHLICTALLAGFCLSASVAVAQPASRPWTAGPDKVGPLKFGMSVTEAFKAMDAQAALSPLLTAAADAHCEEIPVPGQVDTVMMFENARLSRVSFYGESPLKTTLGIRIGASESEVMGKYPKAESTPREPIDTPARDLTFWTKLNVSGIRFQTNASRVVEAIHVGGQSITYKGGCS